MELADWQAQGNHRQVSIGGEDVGQCVSYKMVLSCRFFKRVESLKIRVIGTALHWRERLVDRIEEFDNCRIKPVRTDHDSCGCFRHSILLVPPDADHVTVAPDQVSYVRA